MVGFLAEAVVVVLDAEDPVRCQPPFETGADREPEMGVPVTPRTHVAGDNVGDRDLPARECEAALHVGQPVVERPARAGGRAGDPVALYFKHVVGHTEHRVVERRLHAEPRACSLKAHDPLTRLPIAPDMSAGDPAGVTDPEAIALRQIAERRGIAGVDQFSSGPSAATMAADIAAAPVIRGDYWRWRRLHRHVGGHHGV